MVLAGIRKKSLNAGSPPKACGDKLRGYDDWMSDTIYVSLYILPQEPGKRRVVYRKLQGISQEEPAGWELTLAPY
jgi:hypothetical protein